MFVSLDLAEMLVTCIALHSLAKVEISLAKFFEAFAMISLLQAPAGCGIVNLKVLRCHSLGLTKLVVNAL